VHEKAQVLVQYLLQTNSLVPIGSSQQSGQHATRLRSNDIILHLRHHSINHSFIHSPTLPTSPQHGTAPFPRRIFERCFAAICTAETDSVVVEATGMAIAAVLNNALRFLSRGLVCRHHRKARKTKQKRRSAPRRKSRMS
jgi:hypothetical protein